MPWVTHEPTWASVIPIADRKKDRVPDPVCGSSGLIAAVDLPPTLFQVRTVQV